MEESPLRQLDTESAEASYIKGLSKGKTQISDFRGSSPRQAKQIFFYWFLSAF